MKKINKKQITQKSLEELYSLAEGLKAKIENNLYIPREEKALQKVFIDDIIWGNIICDYVENIIEEIKYEKN